MVFLIPEDMKKLKRIYLPYMDGCKLKSDAPKEAKLAFDKYMTWFKSMFDK